MSLAEKLFFSFKGMEKFTLEEAYNSIQEKPKETIRARIYENLGIKFERVAKGVYRTLDKEEVCIVMEGDGRDLSMLKDNSIDCILTDHPWLDMKSNKGGTRAFAKYDCFKYTFQDFQEKARVLKDGCKEVVENELFLQRYEAATLHSVAKVFVADGAQSECTDGICTFAWAKQYFCK